ncbi:Heat shock factor (HSF)-type DNA-binding [Arabidopsis suecica]|uniref:Heat shock factor (HSF)-type DNA-binding n=1 Tax=Arabidopsis suecica TaxID=45249 RepID=A0A8T2BR56_ARASU|nr:Heat shock factor (HSF)-type DNA-binding [Arabidopsis suecica]
MDRRSNGDHLGSIFRSQLHEMVDDPSTDSIVSWSESSKSFIVWDDEKFYRVVFPRDDLKRLDFRKVEESEKWEYACDYFVRAQPELKPPPPICGLSPVTLRQHEIYKGLVETDSVSLSSLSCYREMAGIVNQRLSAVNKARPRRRSCLVIPQLYEMVDDPSTDSIISHRLLPSRPSSTCQDHSQASASNSQSINQSSGQHRWFVDAPKTSQYLAPHKAGALRWEMNVAAVRANARGGGGESKCILLSGSTPLRCSFMESKSELITVSNWSTWEINGTAICTSGSFTAKKGGGGGF